MYTYFDCTIMHNFKPFASFLAVSGISLADLLCHKTPICHLVYCSFARLSRHIALLPFGFTSAHLFAVLASFWGYFQYRGCAVNCFGQQRELSILLALRVPSARSSNLKQISSMLQCGLRLSHCSSLSHNQRFSQAFV